MDIFQIIVDYQEAFLNGLWVTVKLSSFIWGVGIFLGGLLGVIAAQAKATVGLFVSIGAFFLSGLPVLVLLFWLHYPLQAELEIVIDPFVTAAFALSIVNIFGVAQVVRDASIDFPQQYILAARVTGLSSSQTLLNIKLPILLRQLIPVLLNLQVVMFQSTLFASLISVEEIFRVAQRINSMIYKPVEIYSALGIVFLLVCLPLNGLALWLRWKYTRNISEN